MNSSKIDIILFVVSLSLFGIYYSIGIFNLFGLQFYFFLSWITYFYFAMEGAYVTGFIFQFLFFVVKVLFLFFLLTWFNHLFKKYGSATSTTCRSKTSDKSD